MGKYLTLETLKEVLSYNETTGQFTWASKPSNKSRAKVGAAAGSFQKTRGYWLITILGEKYLAHRLAWLWFYGEWPSKEIDHINRNRLDNRICNLRLATSSENKQNAGVQSRNKSGHKGIKWYERSKKWRAQITVNKKQIHLGIFECFNEAVNARILAETTFHPFASK
jgi:hypothetical protein